MKLSKFDIGGEIISILTRGMYPDPRDAIREYIQNGIDAKAQNIAVKVRQNSVVVQDDGTGMDRVTMRKAIRVGVSDKNPTQNVGFMGIGIYSAFHLCNKLVIYSNTNNSPNRLELDFEGMRELLKEEKEFRLKKNLSSEERTDLQTLLERYINLNNEDELSVEEFPIKGTRVEMQGLNTSFYPDIADFEKLSKYMKEVVPLHFDYENFKWGEKIENKLREICIKHEATFELVNIDLQVHNISERLYRPYKDSDFHNNSPQEPIFEEIKSKEVFFGVSWGCLNTARNKILNKELRGFLLKKQGFAIGTRENLLEYFPRGKTFFDRYTGEVILVHKEILPNSSRSDFEYSPLRTQFYNELKNVAGKYDDIGNTYQEQTKAEEVLGSSKKEIQNLNKSFSEFDMNPDELLKKVVKIEEIKKNIDLRIKNRLIKHETIELAKKLKEEANFLEKTIQNKIFELAESPKSTKKKKNKRPTEIAKSLSEIDLPSSDNKNYENIIELFIDLEYELSDEIINALRIIDEKFIQGTAENKKHYYELLNELKEMILD